MKFHVVWPTRERLATHMLHDPNDAAWLHALPVPVDFSPSSPIHCRHERNAFGPPKPSP
jgi:hypothetical protein